MKNFLKKAYDLSLNILGIILPFLSIGMGAWDITTNTTKHIIGGSFLIVIGGVMLISFLAMLIYEKTNQNKEQNNDSGI